MTEDEKITIKAYVDQRFLDYDRAIKTAMEAADRATSRANDASDRRFESVNEFRNALSDQQRSLMSRSEYEQGHRNLTERITSLEQYRYELGGGSKSNDVAISRAIAALAIIISLIVAAEQFFRSH